MGREQSLNPRFEGQNSWVVPCDVRHSVEVPGAF